MKEHVALVILSYNGLKTSLKFLSHLRDNTDPTAFTLYWIDNGSTDGTVETLDALYEDNARKYAFCVKKNEKNEGVIGGRNMGFDAFLQDESLKHCSHLMFLDNDQYVKPGWLEHHMEVLNSGNDMVGVEAWQMNDSFVPKQKNERLNDYYNWVGCGGMLMPRSTVMKIGRFDIRFNPSYFEDPDYCFRAFQNNLRVGWNFTAKIYHEAHQTLGSAPDKAQRFANSLMAFRQKWKGTSPPRFMQTKLPIFGL